MAAPMPRDQQHSADSQLSAPTVTPAGSFRGLLSRTLSRGRSAEQISHRTAKPKLPSPRPKTHLDGPTAATSSRARSTTWSDRSFTTSSKDARFCSRRASAKNPPPFAEAFRHAILHAKLDTPIPSGTLKKDKTAVRSPAIGVDVGASPLTGAGRSSRSNSGSHNLVTKIFILSDDGCILQYDADGPSNRTPERVLELGPQSISVASDAIPGKHWVLNVVYDGRQPSSQPKDALKPTRPRIFSRKSSEAKKTAREMLLVFNDDGNFDQWLICVRKEIEALGGLEYRPDSRNAAVLLRTKQPTVESSPISVHFQPAPFVRPLNTPKDTSEFQPPLGGTGSPNSPARSSVMTSTDLDRLRDSVIDTRSFESEAGSSYVECSQEHGIPDISVVLSETTQANTTMLAASSNARRRKKEIAPIVILPGSRRRSASWSGSCSPNLASAKFPRTPTLATDALHGMAGAFQVPPSPVSPVGSLRPDHSPFFFMNQFQFTPYTETESDSAAPVSGESTSTSMLPTPRDSFSAEEFDRFAGCHRQAFDDSSIEEVAPGTNVPPPPYSLAPQRKSSLVFRDQPMRRRSPRTSLLGLGISGQADEDTSSQPETYALSHSRQQLPISTLSTDLASTQPQDSERSPVVIDRHLDTCFGFEPLDGEPKQTHIAGSGSVIATELESVEPQATCTPRTGRPELHTSQKIHRQRSMPNLLCKSSPAPPPSAPLPAIPIQGSTGTNEQRERSSVARTVPIEQPDSHHVRSTTLDSPRVGRVSPLNSNPVSPAEMRFARRLSTVNGFPPIDTVDQPAETSTSYEKRSISKSPPPSTWEVWKKSPKLSSAPISRRGSCRSTTPPAVTPAVPALSIDGLLRKASSAAAHERQTSKQGDAADGEAKTIEVNGFRFPVAI